MEGRLGGSYDAHFVRGACLIRVAYRSNITSAYVEGISNVATDATIAAFASGVPMPLTAPIGASDVLCTVNTHKGEKRCDSLAKFHELVKKEYKF